MKGPLAEDESRKFSRGVVVHQLLEILPQLPEGRREKALLRYLARPHLGLPPDQQKSFAAEILAVLRHPEFAAIFGPGSRAEVPVTGLAGGSKSVMPQVLSGQIDRILVRDKEVLIIDYKTNRPPPARAEGVPVIYLKQMAAYRSVIYNVYLEHRINAPCCGRMAPFSCLFPIISLTLTRRSLNSFLGRSALKGQGR